MLGSGLSKESALWMADPFTDRAFAIIQHDGSLSAWFDFLRGLGQGLSEVVYFTISLTLK